MLADAAEKAYPKAIALAVRETGLPPDRFPAVCPFSLPQLLDESIHLWNARLSAGPLVLFADLKMQESLLNGELSAVIQPFSVSISLTDSKPKPHLVNSPGLSRD